MPEIGAESARAIAALIKSAAAARVKNGDFTTNSGLNNQWGLALTPVWRRRLNAQSLRGEDCGDASRSRILQDAAAVRRFRLSRRGAGLHAPPPRREIHAAPETDVHRRARPHALVKEDLEAFFDGIIPLQLERSDVAGATVLVMRGGETLLQKGYGFSDLKTEATGRS